MSSETPRLVFIDSCAVNKFALANIDPARLLTGSPFRLAVTPGLEAEYRRALAHRLVEPHIKALLTRLLANAVRADAAVPRDEETDRHLARLCGTAFVVTLDRKPPWNHASGQPGLVLWAELEAAFAAERPFLDVLRARAGLMP